MWGKHDSNFRCYIVICWCYIVGKSFSHIIIYNYIDSLCYWLQFMYRWQLLLMPKPACRNGGIPDVLATTTCRMHIILLPPVQVPSIFSSWNCWTSDSWVNIWRRPSKNVHSLVWKGLFNFISFDGSHILWCDTQQWHDSERSHYNIHFPIFKTLLNCTCMCVLCTLAPALSASFIYLHSPTPCYPINFVFTSTLWLMLATCVHRHTLDHVFLHSSADSL